MIVYRNNWSCLVDAAAWVIGEDPHDIERIIGHDGSEIFWPDRPEPYCRKSFTTFEVSYALYIMGFHVLHWDFADGRVDKAALGDGEDAVVCYENHAIGKRGLVVSNGDGINEMREKMIEAIVIYR